MGHWNKRQPAKDPRDKSQVIFGINPIEEALDAYKEFEKVFIQKGLGKTKFKYILDAARERNIPVSEVPIQKLNQWTTKAHQGVVALLSLITYSSLDQIIDTAFESGVDPLILTLDNVTDIRNFGAISRSAEALGVSALLIPIKGGAMINGDAIKTSAGALNHIPVCRATNLFESVSYLKKRGLRVVSCTEKSEKNIHETDLKGPLCIVMGAEDKGISTPLINASDELAAIPMAGKISSLNVSVASGIVLYEALSQRLR
jgi:23S rRNA (guanosine2251-2'-O)-methyltransferase